MYMIIMIFTVSSINSLSSWSDRNYAKIYSVARDLLPDEILNINRAFLLQQAGAGKFLSYHTIHFLLLDTFERKWIISLRLDTDSSKMADYGRQSNSRILLANATADKERS